jgi:hypothetical protein
MMNPKRLLLITLGILLLITSYLSLTTQLTDKIPPDKIPLQLPPTSLSPLPPLEFTGKIIYVPQEQGFYGIASETGKKYVPLNLVDILEQQKLPLQDGLLVHIKAEKNEPTLGIHLWGEYINILTLSLVNDTGEVTTTK